MLPLRLEFFAIATLLCFMGWVAYLIRHRRLGLTETLPWLLSTFVALVVTLFPSPLIWVARVLRFEVPSNALFVFAYLYVLWNVLVLTINFSTQTARLRRLAQECALLDAEVRALQRRIEPVK
jgi:hypothetical protein